MLMPRVIPVLLMDRRGLIKGVRFSDHRYVGDVMNTIRLFNDKRVDELVLLDIVATQEGRTIAAELVCQLSKECLMPFAVGGGIRTLEEAKRLFGAGAEKITLSTAAVENPDVISQISEVFGAQAVIVSVDARRDKFGQPEVFTHSGRTPTGLDPVTLAKKAESYGAGEILLNLIDRDGTLQGYDLDLIRQVSAAVTIPVMALGGAGKSEHLREAIMEGGAAAAAAGSLFVFHGRKKAVLISYPSREELDALLAD